MPVRSRTLALVLALAAAVAVLAAPTAGAQEVSDTLTVIKDGEEAISNAEVAARLSEATFESAGTVLIGRDDEFADAMTSGLLQADSPLLLVPREGPVPQRVLEELAILNPSEVVLLGGPDALTAAVEEELADAGYTVRRTFGPSRFETATAIADEGPTVPGTIMIARAFGTPGGDDPTQAFADAMAAGGWAADERWPILLTQTEELPETTRQWLQDNDVQTAYVLGGTAAVSAEVEAELRTLVDTVERVAGADRFETAIEIAKERGAETAADASRVTLIEGQDEDAWAAGFSAAAHSAEFDAPIVLANDKDIPDATLEWLTGAVDDPAFAQDGEDRPASQSGFVLTCVVPFPICREARAALDLPDPVAVGFTPASGTEVQRLSGVQVAITGETDSYVISGDCLTEPVEGTGPSTTVTITAEAGTDCTITVVPILPGGAAQEGTSATYTVTAPPPPSGPSTPAPRILVELDPPSLVVSGPSFTQTGAPDLSLIDITNSNRADIQCDGCEQLRVSDDGRYAVVVVNDTQLGVLRAPGFDDLQLLPNLFAITEYDLPQFLPDADGNGRPDAIVAQVVNDGENAVLRLDLDTFDEVDSEVHNIDGDRLAGPNAAAIVGGVETALILTFPVGCPSSGTCGDELRSLDLATGLPSDPLFSPAGDSITAALHPTGLYALAVLGEGVYFNTLTADPSAAELAAIDILVPTFVDADTVAGVQGSGASAHDVRANADGSVSGTNVPNLYATRPGVLGTSLLAGLGDDLYVGGSAFGDFGQEVRNPHVVSRSTADALPVPPPVIITSPPPG